MTVDDTIQQQIAEAARRREQRRQRRAELDEARQYGLRARMRNKRARWDDEGDAA